MTDAKRIPWTLWDVALVVLLLGGLVCWARLPYRPPEPVGMEAPDTAFSAERALEHLSVVAAGPHLPGTPAHEAVRMYLLDELRSLGLEMEVQATTSVRGGGRGTRAVAVWNVLGRVNGTDPSGAVLLMAHYDPVAHSSGASDAGTGVAAIVEAVRALREGPPLRNDLIVFISDAEELGLMGARAFVQGHRWFSDVSVVLNFEMRGHEGASWMFENAPGNGWVIREWAKADPRPVGNSMSLDVYRSLPNDTDYSPFRDAGVQGLNFAAIGGGNLYHLSLDDLDHNSPATLQHQGTQALSMARHFGTVELGETAAPDLAFVRVSLFGLLVFPPGWNWLGVVLAVGLAVACLLVGKRSGRFRLKGLAMGFALGTVSLVVAALFGWLIFRGAQGMHPEFGRIVGSSFHREGWYFLAVLTVSLTLLLRFMGFGRRWFNLSELAWGAALLPLSLAGFLAWATPLAALNLVWPVVFGEAALLLFLMRLEKPSWDSRARAASLVALGLVLMPVVFILIPTIEMLWVAMNISFAPALAGLATLTFILLLPLLAPLQHPNRWWAPVFIEAFVLLSFGLGLINGAPGPDNPTPTSLFYVMDRDQGVAWWATSDRSQEPWIRSRVPDREPRYNDETFFPQGFVTAPADPLDVPGPEVSILKDTLQGGRRVLRLAITSGLGAEVLELSLAEGTEATLLGVGDWIAPDGEGASFPLNHWGDPGGPVEVEFSVPEGEAVVDLLLRETSYRPQRFLGEEPFQRPPHLIPAPRGGHDVAIFGVTIQIPVGSGSEVAG